MVNIIIIAKILQPKSVRIMDMFKRNILSSTIIADKILSKTIKVTVGNCLIYIPEVIRLFFKPLLLPLAEPYQQKQKDIKASILSVYLIFYAD